jgi:glycosyltransferase involved in cell wall biosynthesis
MPPVATGIARCSADLLTVLETDHEIDVFVDEANITRAPALNADPRNPRDPRLVRFSPRNPRSAHDFVWQHRKHPYDLIVYQLGNSSHHDYQWPYLFRYPGLAVLHDAHLHHARASCLLRTRRSDDYRAEFRANHPDADPSLAELAIAGFDNHLHYFSPMTKLVVERSRLTAVHSPAIADRLRREAPNAAVESIRLGHGTAVSDDEAAVLGSAVRARHGIAADSLLFGCYGGLTPDKRIPQILDAFAAIRAYVPRAHLLLAGALVDHYDLRADVDRLALQSCTTITGYLDSDDTLTAAIAACDVALNLRWPTAREVSGPWLRCLAAGRPTITVDASHLVDVPSLDPRTWLATADAPCTIAIDIVDEDHSLRLAMRRLANDGDLRRQLGRAGRAFWTAHHSVEHMAGDYRRVMERAAAIGGNPPATPSPNHLLDGAEGTLVALAREVGLDVPFAITRGNA